MKLLQLLLERVVLLALLGMLFVPALWSLGYFRGKEILPERLHSIITATEERPLHGVKPYEEYQKEVSVHAWLDRNLQTYVEAWTKENFGLRRVALQLFNQLDYELLSSNRAYTSLVVGGGRQLFAAPYIMDVCARSDRELLTDAQIEKIVEELKQVSAIFQERRVAFAVVITPNKAVSYPDAVPKRICEKIDVDGSNYGRFRDSSKKLGLSIVDGQAITLAFQATSEHPPFPRGGIHWNDLAALQTVLQLVDALNARTPDEQRRIRPPILQEIVYSPPLGPERDLADGLNLFTPDDSYTVPHIRLEPPPPPERILNYAIVGGSFTHQMLAIIAASDALDIARFDYFISGRNDWLYKKGLVGLGADPNPDIEKQFFTRDGVILEINENMIASYHVRLFIDAVLKAGAASLR